ncbi:MAG: sugar kinase [Proteobacteria bacterium]|nr:MAG: sugar kinase [Pseudomonadota bacterium]
MPLIVTANTSPNSKEGMRGSNQTGVRAWNERLVLSLLRLHGALPKVEIARLTGLSAQTISVIMRSLEKEGLLRKGKPLKGKVGQPSVPFTLAANGAYCYGLKIGRRSSELILSDFLGQIQQRRLLRYPWPKVSELMDFVKQAISEIESQLSQQQRNRIAGLGIALPFQLWKWAPIVGAPDDEMNEWQHYDIRSELAAHYDFPIFLENDATAACGAELVFGTHPLPQDFVYFYVAFFIGGGVVLNGSLYSGRSGNAGALGSMPIPSHSGQTTQLIDQASLIVLERMLLQQGYAADRILEHSDHWDIPPSILEQWIQQSAQALAYAIAASIAVIDFEAVLLDGWLPKTVLQAMLKQTEQQLNQLNLAGLTQPSLMAGHLGTEARVLGAASLPLSGRFLVDHNALFKATKAE